MQANVKAISSSELRTLRLVGNWYKKKQKKMLLLRWHIYVEKESVFLLLEKRYKADTNFMFIENCSQICLFSVQTKETTVWPLFLTILFEPAAIPLR